MVVAVTRGDVQSACHNTTLVVALVILSRSVDPLSANSAFLCINTSEICIPHLNPQLEP